MPKAIFLNFGNAQMDRARRYSIFAVACFLTMVFQGCAFLRPSAHNRGVVYSGPKARVVVADFAVMAPKAGPDIGLGLREMFLTALTASNHFIITRQVGSQKVKSPPEDLTISVVVADFEPQVSGGSAGTGGGGGVNSGALGGLLGATLNKAHIALDIRVTDAVTSEIVAAGKVQGQATDISGAVMAGSSSSWALGSNLFAYANTPMEKAIRISIFEAVRYITGSIPEKYNKY
ncbi:MAG: hypothetical protein NTU54_03665 [Candidatus Omnitrophica bacterium]|nr:hypothetical protein [Candidatus Omnitrophota bacterium]